MHSNGVNGVLVVESEKQFDRTVMEAMPATLDVSSLGEGLKLVNKSAKELDHEFATELLQMKEFSPDRPLDDNHVAKLKQAMDRGTFLPEQVTIITCTCDKVEYRMNGQHTSWARLEMPPKYRCPVTVLRYAAKTDHDMRRLYASIDRNKPRSKGNIIISYLYDTEEWAGFSKGEVRLLAEGLGLWLEASQFQRSMRDGDDRAYLLMTKHYEVGLKVGRFLQNSHGRDNRHLFRSPVAAAMFATFDVSAAAALDFWNAVRDGTGFNIKTDPRLVLRNGLASASISKGRGFAEGKKSVSAEEMYRWCLQAWNNWRQNKPTKLLKALLSHDRPKAV